MEFIGKISSCEDQMKQKRLHSNVYPKIFVLKEYKGALYGILKDQVLDQIF